GRGRSPAMTETVDLLIQARFDGVANSADARDWNDVLARLQNARPIVRESRPGRDAYLRRMPRRVALAGVAMALAAAVAAGAFGWPQTVIDFLSAPPAPPKVKNFFGSFNVGAPKAMNPQAMP